jgi:hypothetical protein
LESMSNNGFIYTLYKGNNKIRSTFDVVIHANLIRRLFQIGISKQSILLLQNVYQNAKSME